MNDEIVATDYSKQINAAHAKAVEISNAAKSYADNAVAFALECGKLLIEQKKVLGHGVFGQWCDGNLDFDQRTANRYMKLSRHFALTDGSNSTALSNLDSEDESVEVLAARNITAVSDETKPKKLMEAYIAAGIWPDTNKNEGGGGSTKKQPTITFTKPLDSFMLWFKNRTANDPIEQWDTHTRSLLITNLRPIADVYKRLISLQDSDDCKVLDSERQAADFGL